MNYQQHISRISTSFLCKMNRSMVFFASISDMYAIRKIKYDVCTFLSIIKNWDKDIMLQLVLAYRKKIMLPSCLRCLLEIKTSCNYFKCLGQNMQSIHFLHSNIRFTLSLYNNVLLKNKRFLILLSSLARNSQEPKLKRIFEIP